MTSPTHKLHSKPGPPCLNACLPIGQVPAEVSESLTHTHTRTRTRTLRHRHRTKYAGSWKGNWMNRLLPSRWRGTCSQSLSCEAPRRTVLAASENSLRPAAALYVNAFGMSSTRRIDLLWSSAFKDFSEIGEVSRVSGDSESLARVGASHRRSALSCGSPPQLRRGTRQVHAVARKIQKPMLAPSLSEANVARACHT